MHKRLQPIVRVLLAAASINGLILIIHILITTQSVLAGDWFNGLIFNTFIKCCCGFPWQPTYQMAGHDINMRGLWWKVEITWRQKAEPWSSWNNTLCSSSLKYTSRAKKQRYSETYHLKHLRQSYSLNFMMVMMMIMIMMIIIIVIIIKKK